MNLESDLWNLVDLWYVKDDSGGRVQPKSYGIYSHLNKEIYKDLRVPIFVLIYIPFIFTRKSIRMYLIG